MALSALAILYTAIINSNTATYKLKLVHLLHIVNANLIRLPEPSGDACSGMSTKSLDRPWMVDFVADQPTGPTATDGLADSLQPVGVQFDVASNNLLLVEFISVRARYTRFLSS
jgi:hypothetical protein